MHNHAYAACWRVFSHTALTADSSRRNSTQNCVVYRTRTCSESTAGEPQPAGRKTAGAGCRDDRHAAGPAGSATGDRRANAALQEGSDGSPVPPGHGVRLLERQRCGSTRGGEGVSPRRGHHDGGRDVPQRNEPDRLACRSASSGHGIRGTESVSPTRGPERAPPHSPPKAAYVVHGRFVVSKELANR